MRTTKSKQPLPDILGPGLRVVFVGLNPGAAAAAAGHHFLGRGNRFWKVLHLAGFTARQIAPEDDSSVLALGYGLTTVVARPTARADQVASGEFADAAGALRAKIERHQPDCIAFLGKAAYSEISGMKKVDWGEQGARFGGARAWVIPNPSGLNKGFSLERLVAAYGDLNEASRTR
jgi:TDG/mug DNA glycosylase family protein